MVLGVAQRGEGHAQGHLALRTPRPSSRDGRAARSSAVKGRLPTCQGHGLRALLLHVLALASLWNLQEPT